MKINIKEKISVSFKNWKSKSIWSKLSDVLFWGFILAILLPQTRLIVLSGVQRLIAMPPSVNETSTLPVIEPAAYDWPLTRLDGTQLNFNDYKGKVIFINFWATWCPPCVAEFPSIQELYSKYKDSDVVFIMVSNEKLGTIESFIEKYGYDFPVYYTQYQAPALLQSSSIPATFIIDKAGKIHVDERRAKRWHTETTTQLLDQLLKN